MKLAIVMPAYNESACIERVVGEWLAVFEKVPGALFVINDGSRDNTGELLDRLAAKHANLRVIHQKNAGHGAAVLNGYRTAIASGAEFIFQTDSDDQFEREDFWNLWAMKDTSSFILGYREHRQDPLSRLIITRINKLLCFLCFGVRLRDFNVPFRLMRASFLDGILRVFPADVFAPNIFCSVTAKLSGARIVELSVRHRERKTGTVSILRWKLMKVCLRCVREIVAFRVSLAARRKDLRALGEKQKALSGTRAA
jgi:dolichol-phosphate mannosyltransferase